MSSEHRFVGVTGVRRPTVLGLREIPVAAPGAVEVVAAGTRQAAIIPAAVAEDSFVRYIRSSNTGEIVTRSDREKSKVFPPEKTFDLAQFVARCASEPARYRLGARPLRLEARRFRTFALRCGRRRGRRGSGKVAG